MSLTLELCDDKQLWDRFVEFSPQRNVFCMTAFLDALGVDYDLLLVKGKGSSQLGAVVLKKNCKAIEESYPMSMYIGILFDGSSMAMANHKRVKWALDVTDFLLGEMEQRYDCITFCLHYGVGDLRSFQWFHHHEPQYGQFQLQLRYTGLLDLSAVSDFDEYLMTIRKVRRYDYRCSLAAGLSVEESRDLDELERLYKLTFERQEIEVEPASIELLRSIAGAALSKDFGQLLICRNKQGLAASATLFLHDSHCAYYLVGANDPAYRDSGSGNYLLLENIRRYKERSLAKVDFVGINSPNRGDFKTSFNAIPVPYFITTWKGPGFGSR